MVNIIKPVRLYFGFALLCLSPSLSAAQNYTQADTNTVNKLFEEIKHTGDADPPRVLEDAQKILAISARINFARGIVRGYEFTGVAYGQMGDVKNAIINDDKALQLSRQYQVPDIEASVLTMTGNFLSNIGDVDKAFDCFIKSLEICRRLNSKKGIGKNLSAIALLLCNQNKFEESNKYCLEALAFFKEIHDTLQETIILSAIGCNYTDMKKYPEARSYLTQALKLAPTFASYGNLGYYYQKTGNPDSALHYFQLANDIVIRDSDATYYAVASGDMGVALVDKKEYEKAIGMLKKSYDIGVNIKDNESIEKAVEYLSIAYYRKGDYKNAWLYQKEYDKLKDSIENNQKQKKMQELLIVFDVKQTEAKNEALQKENVVQKLKLQRKNFIIYGSLAALLGLLGGGTLLMRQSRLKANQQKAELEQKQLRAQMNPHFIFNCLNSIQHFVVANDVRNANKYLSGFALLMRQTLENSKESVITLRKEIAYLENYLELELMRFEDKFTCRVVCADNINIDTVEIPPMIIQPFIENAIRHGLCYLTDRKGELTIRFYMERGHLFCEIDDNGIGREQSQKLKMQSDTVYESRGMELTRQRLALVSRNSGSDYQIAITDKKDKGNEAGGTTILIKFPVSS